MKSVIESTNRTDRRLYIVFKHDNELLKNVEHAFRKLKPRFKLLKFRKYNGEKWLSDFYISDNKDFNFTIVIKKGVLRLKLKTSSNLINKFMKGIMKYAEFAKYPESK